VERQELLIKLSDAWTAICLNEDWGDVAGAREYWETCTLAQLQHEWQKTVNDWPEFV
jgi:hypothetical protein